MNRPTHAFLLPFIAAAALAATAGCTNRHVVDTSAELKISKVVLYQNGIGYFERRGNVTGDKLELRVRPDQVNDVLKSLAVLDFSGGQTSSVGLPVERNSARLARELPRHVRRASGLKGMLRVLRGVDVSVDTGDSWVRGRVVGVEGGGKAAKVTLMTATGEMTVVRLGKIDELRIHDRALAVGLSRSLDISKRDGRWKPISLTVRLAGDKQHELLISYIHEVPIWRPAYRAWVDKDRKVQLQGWAIIDNVSGEDWTDVALSLVVGSPLSFRYNLHRTHWVNRPDLSGRMPSVAAAPPPPDVGYEDEEVLAEGAMGDDDGPAMSASGAAVRPRYKAKKRAESKPMSIKRGRRRYGKRSARTYRPKPKPAPMRDYSRASRRAAMERSAAALVKGRKVGALYKYDALTPITVPDGKAALVNIVNRKVDGEDVFLFRSMSGSPFRAVLIRNTGKGRGKAGKGSTGASALESGPITLYVDGTFAGEGFLGRVDTGATTFVPYAQEGGFKLRNTSSSKTTEARLVKILDGRVHVQARRIYTRTIRIESSRDKESLCYVKVGLRGGGWKLKDPPKDIVKAGGQIYLPVRVPAKGKGTATLIEESPLRQSTTYLSHLVLTAFKLYLEDEKADERFKGPIRELLALHEQQAELNRQRSTLYKQRNLLSREAHRIRRNLDSLPLAKVADKLRKQLVAQLKSNSSKAARVAKDLVDNEVKRAAAKERLVTLLRAISMK